MLSRVCWCMNRRFWLNKISASLETKVNKLLLFNNRVYKCMQDFSLGTFSFANKTNRKKLLIGRKVLQQNIWVTLGEEMAKKLVGCIWCGSPPADLIPAPPQKRVGTFWKQEYLTDKIDLERLSGKMKIDPCSSPVMFTIFSDGKKTGQRCTKITGALVRMQN